MALIETNDSSLLYTGDFKLRCGLSAELCDAPHAEVLIMETTYGRPEYIFPPTADVLPGVIRFCREAIDNDEVPVLLGYSLGKCQEILRGLADANLPLMLHGSVYRLTRIYEQFGQVFPKYERYSAGSVAGKVLICPPHLAGSALLRALGKTRCAVLTGWAMHPNCKYRYQADAAFPISDHADFNELVELAKRVNPRKIYTVHGFAADFAQTLRKLGFDAQALSQNEQLIMSMEVSAGGKTRRRVGEVEGAPAINDAVPLAGTPFAPFADTCFAISQTTSKLEKVRLLAEYLQSLPSALLPTATTWFTGVPFPSSQNKILQLGWALIQDATCAIAQVAEEGFHRVYLKHSDLGETAFELFANLTPAPPALTIEAVAFCFEQFHSARGPTGKFPLLKALLFRCSAAEAKFVIKILTGDLRIGLKEGLVEDAIARAFNVTGEEVRKANLLLGNIGATAALAKSQTLASATLTPFQPIKFMLASPEETAGDLWNRVCSWSADSPLTVLIEDKYDGIRCQLHKVGQRVALYSRDLKDITSTFHDLETAARSLDADAILDGEIVAMRGDTILPFAELQRRLGRRERDLFMGEEIPIRFVAFDLLWKDGNSLLESRLCERRAALEAFNSLPDLIRVAHITAAHSIEDIEATFQAARERGNEGIMAKDPNSVYAPGRRGLSWLKLKKALATLDCVVIGAEYGHGKRHKVLSDYTFAVRDERTGEFKTIGKAYTGLTDAEIAQLTQHFLKTAIRQHGRYFEVEPDTVLEIAFDRLQPSNRHSSGLAMRFPRIIRIRTDKTLVDIDTLETARKLVASSKE